jgi:hypothetical protein
MRVKSVFETYFVVNLLLKCATMVILKIFMDSQQHKKIESFSGRLKHLVGFELFMV